MGDTTIIQQGRFTSTGVDVTLDIRSDIDWMEVLNETQWATTQGTGRGVKFEWQRGLAVGHAFEYTKADSTNVLQAEKITSGGFTLEDGLFSVGAAVTGTTITKADPPVCTAASHGYANGDVIMLTGLTNMTQLAGPFFTIGSVATNTFELTHMDTNTSNFTQEAAFTVRKLDAHEWDVQGSIISAVTTGSTTQVQLTQATGNGFTAVGQVMKFNVPAAFGMVELDGLTGEITAINTTTNTYTVAVDSSAFTAFAWPATTALPMSFPAAIDAGTTSGTSLADATDNVAILGMKLEAGIDGPAGSSSDVIYWRAGKSFSVSNA